MGIAAPFPAQGWPKFEEPGTRLSTRARRLIRMSAHLGRAWFEASSIAGDADRERRQRLMERWSRATLDSLNVRVVTRGRLCPELRSSMLVANHISWLDTCVLGSIRGARFVAKSEVRPWPVVGTTAHRLGNFFHIRGHFRDAARVKNRLAAALRAGDHIVVFPEGTTTDGCVLNPFYAALVQAAIDAQTTVQAVAIRYTDPDGRRNDAPAFIDDLTFVDSLRRILREPEIVAELTFGEPLPAARMTRRELTDKARDFIAGALGIPKVNAAASWGRVSVRAVPREDRPEPARRPNRRLPRPCSELL